jgi:hypothetical protein
MVRSPASASAEFSLSAGSPRAVVRYTDGVHCIAWVENVQLILSCDAPTSAVMRTIIAELDALARTCRTRTGALLVINSSCPPPTEEARSYIRAELARSSMVAAAQVVEGTGFRGAAMRAVLSVLQLALRAPYPMMISSTVEEGASWLCKELQTRVGIAPTAANLVLGVRECQATGFRAK